MPWILYTPDPRRKDETMNPHAVFFINSNSTIDFGHPNRGAPILDSLDDPRFGQHLMHPSATAELLRRRPDPARAEATIKRLEDSYATVKTLRDFLSYRDEVGEAHGILNGAGETSHGHRLGHRLRKYVEARASADIAQTYGANEATARESLRAVTKENDDWRAIADVAHEVLDSLGVPNGLLLARLERLRKMLRDPAYLAILTEKAAAIADMRAKVAELSQKIDRMENE